MVSRIRAKISILRLFYKKYITREFIDKFRKDKCIRSIKRIASRMCIILIKFYRVHLVPS